MHESSGGTINIIDPPPADVIFGYGSSTNVLTNKDFTEAELGTYPRVETMRIVSNSGYVGIGTSSTEKTLDVNGDVRVRKDLTIDGSLNVIGTTTTINTSNLDISDNIIILNDTGDVGIDKTSGVLLKQSSSSKNKFMGWDNDDGSFVLAETDNDGSNQGIVVGDLQKLKAKELELEGVDISGGNIKASGDLEAQDITIKGSMKIYY